MSPVRRLRRIAAPLAVLTAVLAGCTSSPDPTGEAEEAGVAGEAEEAAAPDAAEPKVDESDTAQQDADTTSCEATADAEFPDVVDVALEQVEGRQFRVSATLCSAYDTPQRYADAWRVMTPVGDVLGVRELLHDHAGEQPFTRSLSDPVEVPDGVDELVVEGRDLANGWGGSTLRVPVPEE